jgi:hypothetical protein
MAVHPGEFTPKSAEEPGSWRRFNARQSFDTLAISLAMDETTDTTYSIEEVGILAKGVKLSSLFNSSVHIADYRRYPHHFFILQLQFEVDRLG